MTVAPQIVNFFMHRSRTKPETCLSLSSLEPKSRVSKLIISVKTLAAEGIIISKFSVLTSSRSSPPNGDLQKYYYLSFGPNTIKLLLVLFKTCADRAAQRPENIYNHRSA